MRALAGSTPGLAETRLGGGRIVVRDPGADESRRDPLHTVFDMQDERDVEPHDETETELAHKDA